MTWSCTHQAGSTECSPSAPNPHRRSCRRCAHSWRSRSWWHQCRDSATQWGSPRTTALASPPPLGLALEHRLQKKRNKDKVKCFAFLAFHPTISVRKHKSEQYLQRVWQWEARSVGLERENEGGLTENKHSFAQYKVIQEKLKYMPHTLYLFNTGSQF